MSSGTRPRRSSSATSSLSVADPQIRPPGTRTACT